VEKLRLVGHNRTGTVPTQLVHSSCELGGDTGSVPVQSCLPLRHNGARAVPARSVTVWTRWEHTGNMWTRYL